MSWDVIVICEASKTLPYLVTAKPSFEIVSRGHDTHSSEINDFSTHEVEVLFTQI